MNTSDHEIILEFDHVLKRFGSVLALDQVSFAVQRGEVHCLVGENGAGKSTLIKILTGAYYIDSGCIHLNGKCVDIIAPTVANQLGIAVVYQEMNTLDKLSVVDNIMIGAEYSTMGFNRRKKNTEAVRPYLKMVGMDIDPATPMNSLSIAEKQMVMIAKALRTHATIIVLDEPTAMLNEQEVAILFKIIDSLRAQGITILYISHRMEEIYKIGDHVTVLKDGSCMGTFAVSDITMPQLITKMVGRELSDIFPEKDRKSGEKLLEVNHLTNRNIKDINFTLHAGEVLGIAGLVGAGRTETLRAIFAADPKSGKICLHGRQLQLKNPSDAIRNGIGLLPEERKNQGIIGRLSVRDNITLIYSQLHAKYGFLRKKNDRAVTKQYINSLQIKTPNDEKHVGELSGGNQQKVIIAKWLSIQPKVLLLDEPTQGIDVGVKSEIYRLIDQMARKGMGVIVVSSDLMEIIGISDRILVMREGKIAGEVSGDNMTESEIMMYAMGVEQDER